MLGPFSSPPFRPWVQISPMLTRPKKEEGKRRVIVDLSFPEGEGVNAGIPKNVCDGELVNYSLPTVADLGDLIAGAGMGSWLWKVDLERAYRQLRADPLAYPLLGVQHEGQIFIDICPSFGCRSSGAAQQRVSRAVCHVMKQAGHTVLAYVDDFGAVDHSKQKAQEGFETFKQTCVDLGLKISEEKSCGPSQIMEWLGFMFNTQDMTITVPENKLQEILQEIREWDTKEWVGRRELQSLAGRLAHISSCIRHSRKFMSRILAQLRATPPGQKRRISAELRKDLLWFSTCARQLNRKQLIHTTKPTYEIQCDACLTGGGGFSADQYYNISFPRGWQSRYHISQLEALNALIAVKTLIPGDLEGHRVVVKTDNAASASVLVTGRSHDPVLAACSRELAMLMVLRQIDIDVVHVPGITLDLADALSRRHDDAAMNDKALSMIRANGLTRVNPVSTDTVLSMNL